MSEGSKRQDYRQASSKESLQRKKICAVKSGINRMVGAGKRCPQKDRSQH